MKSRTFGLFLALGMRNFGGPLGLFTCALSFCTAAFACLSLSCLPCWVVLAYQDAKCSLLLLFFSFSHIHQSSLQLWAYMIILPFTTISYCWFYLWFPYLVSVASDCIPSASCIFLHLCLAFLLFSHPEYALFHSCKRFPRSLYLLFYPFEKKNVPDIYSKNNS